MKTVTNEALAKTRRRQAALLSFGGLAVLGVGLLLNLRGSPNAALVALVAGSVASWAGIVLTERWLRPPRIDDVLARGLARAGKAFVLYNWLLPTDHVLLGPWGLTVFVPCGSDGRVVIEHGSWRESRPLLRRLVTLGRRPLGRPRDKAAAEMSKLEDALVASLPDAEAVPVDAVALFTQPGVEIQGEDPALAAVRGDELTHWLREARKQPRLSNQRRRDVEKALDEMAAARRQG